MSPLLNESILGSQKVGEVLAIIPARGGSQRVKNKNILALGGKPLIAYTIEAAKAAKLVTRVIVSTDSEEIAKVALQYGAEVPFLRPANLAHSNSTEFEFQEHALCELHRQNAYMPELLVNLYPTTPFRKSTTVDAAIEKIRRFPKAHSLRSTRKVSEHPYKMWIMEGDFLTPFVKKDDGSTHTAAYHLLPPVQIQNASIYIVRPSTLVSFGNTVGRQVVSFEMSEEESVDINTPLDFKVAETVQQAGIIF